MGRQGVNASNKCDVISKRVKKCGGNKKLIATTLKNLKEKMITVYQSIADLKNDGQRTAVPEGKTQLILILAGAPKSKSKELINWLKIQLAKANEDLAVLRQTADEATASDDATVADAAATLQTL